MPYIVYNKNNHNVQSFSNLKNLLDNCPFKEKNLSYHFSRRKKVFYAFDNFMIFRYIKK